MKKNIFIKTISVYFTAVLLLSVFLSCSSPKSVQKKLIGKWKVELAEFSTGEVIKEPDMIIEFLQDEYIVYTKGEENFSLYYQVKKDYISYYLETFWKGKKQGERLYFDGNDNISLELSDELNGKKIELKYYLVRIKEKDEEK